MAKKEPIIRECDVLVFGGGLGGCFAAIKAKEAGAKKVIQIDKGRVGYTGCSAFGAGIIASFNPDEQDYSAVFKDVVEQADYLLDQERLEDHLAEIWPRIQEMDKWGVEFEKRADGTLERLQGRGSVPAVMFHGPKMMEVVGKVPLRIGVEQINKVMLTDLLTEDGQVVGAVALDFVNGRFYVFKAKATILATGSCRYKGLEPMQRNVTGDGQAAAYRAGADITNFDMVGRNAFSNRYDMAGGMYISTGSGARFCNAKGEYFMEKYDPVKKGKTLFGTYIPAFSAEVRMGNGPIFIDLTHFPPETVQMMKRNLPVFMKMYERVGIVKGDQFTTKIEWMTSSPRCDGGPLVNRKMETCLPGLYSVGDAIPQAGYEGGQCWMPGAITSGAIAGRNAADFAKGAGPGKVNEEQVEELRKRAFEPMERRDGIEPDQVALATLDSVVPYYVLTITDEEKLKKALKQVEDIRDHQVPLLFAYDPHYLRMALEARNMVLMAEIQIRSLLFREESRKAMAFIREDYPYTDNAHWSKWVGAKEANGKMTMVTRDIPIDQYPIKLPTKEKYLAPLWKTLQGMGKIKIEGGKVIWV